MSAISPSSPTSPIEERGEEELETTKITNEIKPKLSLAQDTLKNYYNSVRGQIIGQSIVESADLATAAISELTQSHSRTIEELNAQIIGLQEQLFAAAGVIESLGGQMISENIIDSVNSLNVRPSFAVDVRMTISRVGEEQEEVNTISNKSNSQLLPIERDSSRLITIEEQLQLNNNNNNNKEEEEEEERQLTSIEDIPSDAFATAQSNSHYTRDSIQTESDLTQSKLFSELLQGRGIVKVQEQQQTLMVAQLKELTSLLARLVKENASYRQEILFLRATTIPVEEHRKVLEERHKLEEECETMKLELLRLETEMEEALRRIPLQQEQEQFQISHIADKLLLNEKILTLEETPSPSSLMPLPKPSSSSISPTRGEETIMHDSTLSDDKFFPARSLIHDNSNNNNNINIITNECNEDELRHGPLWKIAIRELEQQATLAATQLSASERLKEAQEHITELERLNDTLRSSLEKLEAEDACVRADCEHLTFRNGVLSQQVASLLVRVERQRRALERFSNNSHEQLLLSHEQSDGDVLSNTEIIMEGEELLRRNNNNNNNKHGRIALAAQTLLERRKSVSAYHNNNNNNTGGDDFSYLLDVNLQNNNYNNSGLLEIEGGVQTGLNVFARPSYRPRRSVMLRNIGTPLIIEEENEKEKEEINQRNKKREREEYIRVPRLPVTDELSGVALGRPSYYTTLDPARSTIFNQKDNNICASSNSSSNNNNNNNNNSKREGKDITGSATPTLFMSEDGEENKKFLELLREDENFDRYSINSVTDLLRRNQELLQQLYIVTQRADAAEKKLELKERSCVNSDTEAAEPHDGINRKRKREEIEQEEENREVSSQNSSQNYQQRHRKRQDDIENEGINTDDSSQEGGTLDCGNVFSNTSASDSQEQQQKHGRKRIEEENERRLLAEVMDNRYIQLESDVDDQINAVIQKHKAQLTLTDESLASSLLHIIELGRKRNNNNNEESTSNTMKDAIIASLVRVCTQQGVRAANQAIELAATKEANLSEMMRECWAEAQRVLLNSAQELQSALSGIPLNTTLEKVPIITSSHVENVEINNNNNIKDEIQLLHNITSLLRTASLKEHTIQRVLEIATKQRRMIQRVGLEKGKKQPKENDNEKEESEEESPIDSFDNDSNIDTCDSDDDDNNNNSDSEGTHYSLKHLRAQLDGAHTRYEKLLQSHHEERKEHTILLDRMWQLEEEMVRAVRAREDALEQMNTMMSREEYETTVKALDSANENIEELQTQLQHAKEENIKQKEELEKLQQAGIEYNRRREEEAAQAASQLAQRDFIIAQNVQKYHQLQTQFTEQQASIRQYEKDALQHQSEIALREEDVQNLQERLHRAEFALLERQCTQDLLFAIFPDDRALTENRNLIQAMREEKEKLSEVITSLKLDLDATKRKLSSVQLQIHIAEQARQEAELKLQEVILHCGGTELTSSLSLNLSSISWNNNNNETISNTKSARQIELELLRRVNASLLLEKEEWTQREKLLRNQLDALSRDPVSETARRYGLKATHSFEEQLAEMENRCLNLQQKLNEAEEQCKTVEELKNNVSYLMKELDTKRAELEEQKEKAENMKRALHEESESHDAVKLTLAEKEEIINNITSAISTLEVDLEKMEQRLRTREEERKRLYEDNQKLIDTVKALTEEVKKKETERKAAQVALAQGLANVTSVHKSRGRSAGGSTTLPTSITGSLARTPNVER